MKVVLLENVKSVGNVGEIVNVSPGHARNFLIPNGLADVADEGNQKSLMQQQKMLAKKLEFPCIMSIFQMNTEKRFLRKR